MNKNPLKWHLVFSIMSVLASILAVFAAFLAGNIIVFGIAVFICFFVSFDICIVSFCSDIVSHCRISYMHSKNITIDNNILIIYKINLNFDCTYFTFSSYNLFSWKQLFYTIYFEYLKYTHHNPLSF